MEAQTLVIWIYYAIVFLDFFKYSAAKSMPHVYRYATDTKLLLSMEIF